ncbi:Nif3-like dinuclear metal center hexameric protein [Aestuariibacter sp. A3R04]|uniref:Nif3-like dinuclear metal center hexameric protein n=1 Tax=Aestuariibacter sp. A3R04 TaxID=2841571 RepID=UPI001C09904C|nr:Nif3-like dinuclear metal center hexameric protein [Aestuariibacter sp. A3R04]MBU3022962.1 Nif3-like dinuclear metal center hexameric protein [Aestuariibacter sp. A3R04]
MSICRNTLINYLAGELKSADIQDYAPNGLQVEGNKEVSRVVTGVTASQALIDSAVELNADTILVHHGYFWKGENPTITGIKGQRIRTLLQNNINLLAYHLPVDVHPQWGNNVQLGTLLGLQQLTPLSGVKPTGIIYTGKLAAETQAIHFASHIEKALNREVVHVPHEGSETISTVAWCTGGGQGYIEKAAEQGFDAFISGEISEQTTHIAREAGIHYIAAGHHATERYGIKALGEHLAASMGLDVTFVDIDNPA